MQPQPGRLPDEGPPCGCSDGRFVFATKWQTEGANAGSLGLPQGQDPLIAAVAAVNPNTPLTSIRA